MEGGEIEEEEGAGERASVQERWTRKSQQTFGEARFLNGSLREDSD